MAKNSRKKLQKQPDGKTDIELIQEAILLYCVDAPDLLARLLLPKTRSYPYSIIGLKTDPEDHSWRKGYAQSRKYLEGARRRAKEMLATEEYDSVQIMRVYEPLVVEEYDKKGNVINGAEVLAKETEAEILKQRSYAALRAKAEELIGRRRGR